MQKRIFFLIISVLLISAGCSSSNISDCKENIEEFYNDGIQTYYKTCLNSNEINLNNQKENILDYITSGGSIYQIIEQMDFITSYKDGGTKVYHKDDIFIVVCHAIIDIDSYNENIIISNKRVDNEYLLCQ